MPHSINDIETKRKEILEQIGMHIDEELILKADVEKGEADICLGRDIQPWAENWLRDVYQKQGWGTVEFYQVKYSVTNTTPDGFATSIKLFKQKKK